MSTRGLAEFANSIRCYSDPLTASNSVETRRMVRLACSDAALRRVMPPSQRAAGEFSPSNCRGEVASDLQRRLPRIRYASIVTMPSEASSAIRVAS